MDLEEIFTITKRFVTNKITNEEFDYITLSLYKRFKNIENIEKEEILSFFVYKAY